MGVNINQIQKVFTQKDNTLLTVLENIDVTIERGQFVSLLGPSGCGKSTLLSLIAGLTKPTAGEIIVADEKVTNPGPNKGVVFQQAALFPWLSVLDNVKFPLRKQYKKSEQIKIAEKYIKMVQLTKFKDHFPHELSGGMQQRVAIARVLAMNPELLLMDEPFGALDEQTRTVLQKELESIWLQTNKTVIFVTHSIREAVTLSDRILVMGARPGRIIADISIDLNRPRKNKEMTHYEELIMDLLKVEIDKVIKEELSDASNH